jgi:plasmid stabilization system protein ParE
MKLVFSSVFEADFAELVGYFYQRAGMTVSKRFENEVCRLIKLLRQHPEAGRLRRDLRPDGIRSFVIPEFRNYLLFYQVKGEDLILLRVKFGGMDLPGIFQD